MVCMYTQLWIRNTVCLHNTYAPDSFHISHTAPKTWGGGRGERWLQFSLVGAWSKLQNEGLSPQLFRVGVDEAPPAPPSSTTTTTKCSHPCATISSF